MTDSSQSGRRHYRLSNPFSTLADILSDAATDATLSLR